MAFTPAHEILARALARKRKSYSRRALARDLGVSGAFVSNILRGKKAPPKSRLDELARLLELDSGERLSLVKAVLLQGETAVSIQRFVRTHAPEPSIAQRARAGGGRTQSLSAWWIIAVYESLDLSPPHNQAPAVQKRLGISGAAYEQALAILRSEGLITPDPLGTWQKNSQHIYFTSGRSRKSIRTYHDSMIQKARDELKKTSDADFARRLITGFTFALNPAHLEPLKLKITDFLDQLTREGSQGPCQDLYQCNVQLFPLDAAAADGNFP